MRRRKSAEDVGKSEFLPILSGTEKRMRRKVKQNLLGYAEEPD